LKLGELLSADEGLQVALAGPSLGDAYLIAHNPVVKSLRSEFAARGYSMTSRDFCDYVSYPRAALPTILSRKQVPCFDNLSVLRSYRELDLESVDFADLPAYRPPRHLHEIAHCVVHSAFSGISAANDHERVLDILLAESFAQACDGFGSLHTDTPAHRFFYGLHTYTDFQYEGIQVRALLDLIQLIGPAAAFLSLWLSYLYSNFLREAIEDNEALDLLAETVALKRPNGAGRKNLRTVLAIGFGLSWETRVKVNSFYFKLVGLGEPLAKLVDFDFPSLLLASPPRLRQLAYLSEVATGSGTR
jgi:hypothetical protein